MCFDRNFIFIIGIPILIIIEIIRFKKAKKFSERFINTSEILKVTLGIYSMGLIAVTLLPFYPLSSNVEPTANLLPILNTIKDISTIQVDMRSFMIKFWIVNIFGNLFLLTPLAIIIPLIFEKFRNLKSTVLLCLVVSVSIEFIQFLSMFCGNYRSVDIDDVILNTLGSILGFMIYRLTKKKLKPKL